MEESSVQLQNEERTLTDTLQQNDDNTEYENKSKDMKKPNSAMIESALGDNINCHICKIKFSKSFMLNHFSSGYHRNNMNILNEVLARYKKTTAEPVPYFNDVGKLSLHYCDVCNLEVMCNKKNDHFLSELHMSNVNYLQDAIKLTNAYICHSKICNQIVDDDSEEVQQKKYDEKTLNQILNLIKQYFLVNVGNKMYCRVCEVNVQAHNEILRHIKVDHEMVLNSDNVVVSIKINNELKIEIYQHISIITVKNLIMVVAADAWQGLSGNICLLCNNQEFNNKIEHIQKEGHVHKLFDSSIIDANGLRAVSIFLIIGERVRNEQILEDE